MRGVLTPSEQLLEKEQLLNFGVGLDLVRWDDVSRGAASINQMIEEVKAGRTPEGLLEHLGNVVSDIDDVALAGYRKLSGSNNLLFKVGIWSETVPNPASRVRLSTQRDELGQPRAQLDWRLGEQDRVQFKRVFDLVSREFGNAGFGRMRFDFDAGQKTWTEQLRGSFHHMGTTRMHDNPKSGVVDRNCKVHGISNLFIAGSSVFPTYGHCNPTLTIVAMSLRLAKHISSRVIP